MKVYIIEGHSSDCPDDSWVQGAASTPEKAQEMCYELKKRWGGGEYPKFDYDELEVDHLY